MNRICIPKICEIFAMFLLASAAGGATFAAPFQNLDFTDTTLVPDEFGRLPISRDFSAVFPHWGLFFENAEGTVSLPFGPDSYFDSAFTAPNIGGIGNAVLFAKDVPPPFPFPFFPPDFLVYLATGNDFQSGSEVLLVIGQTGEIPSSAKSIRIVIDDGGTNPPFFLGAGGKPVLRFNGYEVVLVEVPANIEDGIFSDGSVVYAGNIESIVGLTRDLRIGSAPNRPANETSGFFHGSTLIDQIAFSALPAPGPPVEVPEPNPLTLIWLAALLSSSTRCAVARHRLMN